MEAERSMWRLKEQEENCYWKPKRGNPGYGVVTQLPNDLVDLAKEISMQNAESAEWLLSTACDTLQDR